MDASVSGSEDTSRVASRTGQAWLTLGVAVLIYAAAQVVGYWVGAAVPSVSDNPAFGTDASASRWLIDYPAYALQAVTIYAITTLAVAWYGWRIRSLALAPTGADADARSRDLAATPVE